MTTAERRLRDALADPDGPHASPDLFSRVVDSIAEDRVRRRRTHRAGTVVVAALALVTAVVVTVTPKENGRLVMDWWILELGTTVLLIGVALWLGPFIKRFGRAYAADVFYDNPQTGKSYIVLTDIVYYLIFAAYILFTLNVETPDDANVTAFLVKLELIKIGGILLIIGVLHGLNIVLMPVLGRLFSLNRHLSGRRD